MKHCFFIGTKGQLIKTAPVIREFQQRDLDFLFVHAGMHGSIFNRLIDQFQLPEPDVVLRDHQQDILDTRTGLQWLLSSFVKGVVSLTDRGLNLIVHGDASPVLTGVVIAKMRQFTLTHLEAGLRSFNFSDPFPEELIRYVAGMSSDYLFAPSRVAVENLKRMTSSGHIVHTRGNTVIDAIRYSIKQPPQVDIPDESYALFTTHRYETIGSKKKLSSVMDIVDQVAKKMRTVFVLHNTTEKKLKVYNMLEHIQQHPRIRLLPLMAYRDFMHLVRSAEFVVTDGGGIQEETYYLGKPCLILRHETEREFGLQKNVLLSDFNDQKITYFLEEYETFRSEQQLSDGANPSKVIADFFDPRSGSPGTIHSKRYENNGK